MADDVTLPGTGDVVAADDIGGIKHQRVKIEHGADGSATDASSASPLPTRPGAPATGLCTRAAVNCAAAGDNVLAAGTAAQTIRLMAAWLWFNAPVSWYLADETAAFHPAINAQGMFLPYTGEPYYIGVAGDDLILNLSAAVQANGSIWYTKG